MGSACAAHLINGFGGGEGSLIPDVALSCFAALHEGLTGLPSSKLYPFFCSANSRDCSGSGCRKMGRATRWLRSLLGGKKESRDQRDGGGAGEERREKKRWSFCNSGRELGEDAGQIRAKTAEEAAWLRSLYAESEKEQSKHAIAVAAATAAAADAAVAAAQAAVAVVRLTSQGRGTMIGLRERVAAVKIQTVFRGYLAKKALRALKALVKLQALVRGYLVRKQATATLHSMQALIRAQASVRALKSRGLLANDRKLQPRRSIERFDDTRSEHMSSFHSRRLSASLDNASNGFDRSPKIVEIDTCRPKSRSSRRTTSPSAMDSMEDISPVPASSPFPCHLPARITIPDYYDWCQISSTAQSTPRYMSSSVVNVPPTPAKSVSAGDVVFRRYLHNCPNYMTNTQSFEAKVRSHSAPKQRPEPAATPRKRVPLSEMLVESRASLSAVGMERSSNFKNAVMGRMDSSLESSDMDYLSQTKW